MANLIPPDAKKAIVTEYWFRVVVMWLIMVAMAIGVVVILQVPTLLLIKTSMSNYSTQLESAIAMNESFEEFETVINEGNTIARLLASGDESVQLSEVVRTLHVIAGNGITLQSIQLDKTDGVLQKVEVQGVATTREMLANFSTDLEADPYFAEATLPFSNLAKDRDIAFTISITPAVE